MPGSKLELNKPFGKWKGDEKEEEREREKERIKRGKQSVEIRKKYDKSRVTCSRLQRTTVQKGKLHQSRVCLQVQVWLRICDAIKATHRPLPTPPHTYTQHRQVVASESGLRMG